MSAILAQLSAGGDSASLLPTALLATLDAFALILALFWLRVPLAAAVLLGSAAIGAMFQMTPGDSLAAAVEGAVEPNTLGLLCIIVILMVLSEMLREAGRMEQIVSLVRAVLRRPAAAMAALPAIIGLLPMPGGALFSAPMVESAAGKDRPTGGVLSAVNYWFRHIWEFWWPLYPGVILGVSLSGVGWLTFIQFNLPLTLFMVAAGLWILRGMHPNLHVIGPPPAPGTKRRLLLVSLPIWGVPAIWGLAAVGIWFLFGPKPDNTGPLEAALRRFIPIGVGLLASLAWVWTSGRLGGKQVLRTFRSGRIYTLALLVLTILIFQHMLKVTGAPDGIRIELARLHVPMEAVVALLPFIAGAVTGVAVGFVGISFPIVLPLAVAAGADVRPYVVLAYAFGHMGQMLSPLHVCQVVSNRYFSTSYGPVYRRIFPAALGTGVLVVAYFLLLRRFL